MSAPPFRFFVSHEDVQRLISDVYVSAWRQAGSCVPRPDERTPELDAAAQRRFAVLLVESFADRLAFALSESGVPVVFEGVES